MKIELSEFSVAAICLTIIVSAVAYFHTHPTYPPAPVLPCPAPVITVAPAVIPAPKVIIKIVPLPQPTSQVIPEVSPDSDSPVDENVQRTVILTSGGPLLVPPRTGVVIPNSLRQPMPTRN